MNLADIGANAINFGDLNSARTAFDGALAIMDSIVPDSEILDDALSLSGSEKSKIFIGEPHERAMCYFYRGLIFLADGDFENARACFINGEMQGVVLNGRATQTNWLSLSYLQALADKLDGSYRAIQFPNQTPKDLSIGDYNEDDDTLIVIMTGYGPNKTHHSTKKGGYGLSYSRIGSQINTVRVCIVEQYSLSSTSNKKDIDSLKELLKWSRPSEDIYIQAVSRGRREMDKILEAKEYEAERSNKNAGVWEKIGIAAGQCGIWGAPVAGIAMLVGNSERERAATANPISDLRQLASLPQNIYIGSFRSSSSQLVIETVTGEGRIIRSAPFSVLKAEKGRINVVLSRIYN